MIKEDLCINIRKEYLAWNKLCCFMKACAVLWKQMLLFQCFALSHSASTNIEMSKVCHSLTALCEH